MSTVIVLSLLLFFVSLAFIMMVYLYGVERKWWKSLFSSDEPKAKPVEPVVLRNCSEITDYKDGDYKCKFPGVTCIDTTSAIPENRIKWKCYMAPRPDKNCNTGPCWDAYKE